MRFGLATAAIPLDRRSAPRIRLDCQARLRTCFGDRPGFLWDLSISGARFQTDDPPKEGTTALLEWASHDAICRVVWSREGMCGLIFERPIARHIVEQGAPPPGPAEPAAELGRIPLGKRSSLRAGLVRQAEHDKDDS